MNRAEGFTLLELIVAMVILAILILIMGAIFHQSSVAWDSGIRKAKGNMSARAAIGFMSRELSEAIAYTGDPEPKLGPVIIDGRPFISFARLTHASATNRRAAYLVSYAVTNEVLVRTQTDLKRSDARSYAEPDNDAVVNQLITNVMWLAFEVPDADKQFMYTNTLPEWVCIRLRVRRMDDVSGTKVFSYGPDGQEGTDDDIRSY